MPQITFILKDGSSRIIDAPVGLSIMEVAVRNALPQIEGSCGGSLSCATCHVYVHPDWWDKVLPGSETGIGAISEEEEDMLDIAFDLRRASRLSCQIIVRPDLEGLVLALPGAKIDWAK